jgi:hypothetical protein
MKHAIAPEHHSFYQFHGWVEFSDLLSSENCHLLLGDLDKVLLKRQHLCARYLKQITPTEKFLHGRDLFRSSPLFKKICANSDFAGIAAALNDVKAVRLGADQLLPGGYILKSKEGKLKEFFPFNEILGGMVISLNGAFAQEVKKEEDPPIPFLPLPGKEGNALFFKREKLLSMDFSLIPSTDIYLLIVYTPQKVFYVHNQNDLNSHTMRELGYQYGDYLTNQKHPLLVR